MPNPAVKPVSVDGTMWGTHGRVGRRQFKLERGSFIVRLPFFVLYFQNIMITKPFIELRLDMYLRIMLPFKMRFTAQ